MAEAEVDTHHCDFKWHVVNPSIPWRITVAKFYALLMRWEVGVRPVRKNLQDGRFSISLQCFRTENKDAVDVPVRNLVISIEREMIESLENYTFGWINKHSYTTNLTHEYDPHDDDPEELFIEIEMDLPNQNMEGNGLVFTDQDLFHLSDDLKRLFDSDIGVESINLREFRAHMCILERRWINLFMEDEKVFNTIRTKISESLLWKILNYMYSGRLPRPAQGRAEMFRVIDRYKLHHLYKVYIRNKLRQYQITYKTMHRKIYEYTLHDDHGQKLNNPSYGVLCFRGTPFELDFRIRFFTSPKGPWFSYSIRSEVPRRFYVQVRMDFMMRVPRRADVIDYIPIHLANRTIPQRKTLYSGRCFFDRNTPELNAFLCGAVVFEEGVLASHFFVVVLRVSDGTEALQISVQGEEIQRQFLKEIHSIRAVSDDLSRLEGDYFEWDLDMFCPTVNGDKLYALHRAIVAARVPEWNAVFENFPEMRELEENEPEEIGVEESDPEESDQEDRAPEEIDPDMNNPQEILIRGGMPTSLRCNLSNEIFKHVVDYIYTGKTFPIPSLHRNQIRDFAVQSGFISLQRAIERMQD